MTTLRHVPIVLEDGGVFEARGEKPRLENDCITSLVQKRPCRLEYEDIVIEQVNEENPSRVPPEWRGGGKVT